MELKILASSGKNLDVFEKDKKIFFSKVKYSLLNKLVEIYNNDSEKLIEIKYGGFLTEKYEITFQSEILGIKIASIKGNDTFLNNNSKIKRIRESFGFKSKSEYKHNGVKIATSKEKYWFWKRNFIIEFEDIDTELKNALVILILTYESGIIAED